jgi:taurine dioxygenase
MSKITTRTLTPTIGAVVEGIDLSQKLADEQIADVRAALLKHKVIFFEDQHITPVQHRDFAARFGELHTHPLYPGVPEAPEMFILDNHASNPTDNDAWHTDVTFIQTPPLGAILYAKLLPPEGGDTCWANMQAAYEGLSKPLQRFLSELDAVHDFARGFPSRGTVAKEAGADKHAKALEEHPPVIHPVVRTHPETGRKALYVNVAHTARFVDMTDEESAGLLRFLFRHQVRPEFTCRFRWEVGSVAFWDNRCAQHNPINDYHGYRRVMHRITLAGDTPS